MYSIKVTCKNTLWFIHSLNKYSFWTLCSGGKHIFPKEASAERSFFSSVESFSLQLRVSQEQGLLSVSFGYSFLMKPGSGRPRPPLSPFSPQIFCELTGTYFELSICTYHIPGCFCLEQKQTETTFHQNNSNHTKFLCFLFYLLFIWVETYTCKGWENTTLRENYFFHVQFKNTSLKKKTSLSIASYLLFPIAI